MKPPTLIILLLLVIACGSNRENNASYHQAPVKVSLSQIIADYNQNAGVADNSYKNKLLLISGKIQNLKIRETFFKDTSLSMTIASENDVNERANVLVLDSERDKFKSLQKGQIIQLLCFGNGKFRDLEPSLIDCKIQ